MLRLCVVVAVCAVAVSPLVAQERVPVTVDYVSVEGIYLGVGEANGLAEGDTLEVFGSLEAPTATGRLVLTSVTRRRSVAQALDPSLALGRGDVVFIRLPESGAPVPGVAAAPPVAAGGGATVGAGASSTAGGGSGGPRVDGRISLDLDARETRTSWAGDLSGETVRRFATPTTRLTLAISDLPGGFALRTNLRASYRYAEFDVGMPATSIRAYEAVAIKSFEAVPLEFRLGRFYNPYESYSTYWDGLLLRVGRAQGFGVGAAAGFEPALANQGFSSERPKVTGFVDYSARGRGWRYDTDASVHMLRPTGLTDRTYGGWTQRLTVGRLSLDQRLRMDRNSADGAWSMSQLRVRGGLRVAGPFRVRGAYGRLRTGSPLLDGVPDGPLREEITAGVGLYGGAGSFSVDGGRTTWEGDDDGWSVSGNAGVRLGDGLLSVSGRHWQRSDMKSLSVAPGLTVPIAVVRTRIAYRYYRTDGVSGLLVSHAADAQAGFTLGRWYQLTVRGQYQWGQNTTGTRVQVGIWRSF